MPLRELIQSNETELSRIYIYTSDEQWDNDSPELSFDSVDHIRHDLLAVDVRAWYIDTNFCLHVYLF